MLTKDLNALKDLKDFTLQPDILQIDGVVVFVAGIVPVLQEAEAAGGHAVTVGVIDRPCGALRQLRQPPPTGHKKG